MPRPVVCGVTLLDLDHVAILGDTLTLIAGEKAGIIKKGIPAVTISTQPREALATLAQHARAVSAPLFLAPPLSLYSKDGQEVKLGLQGDFQRDNAALALALVRIWAARCLPHHDASLPPSQSAPPPAQVASWAAMARDAWGAEVASSWEPATAEPLSAATLESRPHLSATSPATVSGAAADVAAAWSHAEIVPQGSQVAKHVLRLRLLVVCVCCCCRCCCCYCYCSGTLSVLRSRRRRRRQ